MAEGFLIRCRLSTGEPLYRLSPDPSRQREIMDLSDRVNRNRDAFLSYVREILRLQVNGSGSPPRNPRLPD